MKKLSILAAGLFCIAGAVASADTSSDAARAVEAALDTPGAYNAYVDQYKGVYGSGCRPPIIRADARESSDWSDWLNGGLPVGLTMATLLFFHVAEKKRVSRKRD